MHLLSFDTFKKNFAEQLLTRALWKPGAVLQGWGVVFSIDGSKWAVELQWVFPRKHIAYLNPSLQKSARVFQADMLEIRDTPTRNVAILTVSQDYRQSPKLNSGIFQAVEPDSFKTCLYWLPLHRIIEGIKQVNELTRCFTFVYPSGPTESSGFSVANSK